jgi:hypothetical protein
LKKKQEKRMIERVYKDGSTCLLSFPDGSGCAFYPSGRLAISISQIEPGMHVLSAFTDDEINPVQVASFDPYGNGCCNYSDGRIKFLLNPLGGIELDADGLKKKRWNWWDLKTDHVMISK